MRVCLFTPNFLPSAGGAERMADTIVRGLRNRGHAVSVLAQHTGDANADRVCDRDLPYPVRRYRRPPAQHLWPGVLGRALARAFRDDPFEVVLCFYAYPTGYAATRVAAKLGVKIVVSPRGGDLYPNFHGLKKPGVRRAIAAGYRDADRVASLSRWLTMRIRQITELSLEALPPIDQVPNGIDLAAFDAQLAAADRGSLPLQEGERFLLHLGRVAPVKRVPLAIRAVAEEAERFREKHVRYAVVGDGPDLNTVRSVIAEHEIGDIVLVLGQRDGFEKAWLLKHATAFVSTSREEGMPNAVLEALAAGLPVLASDIGPHEELIDPPPGHPFDTLEQSCGILCQSTDPIDWGAKMYGLLEAPLDSMRRRALERREHFTLERTIDGYERSLELAIESD